MIKEKFLYNFVRTLQQIELRHRDDKYFNPFTSDISTLENTMDCILKWCTLTKKYKLG